MQLQKSDLVDFVKIFGGFEAEKRFVKVEETQALLRKLDSMRKISMSVEEHTSVSTNSHFPSHHTQSGGGWGEGIFPYMSGKTH